MSAPMNRRRFLTMSGQGLALAGLISACGAGSGGDKIQFWSAFNNNKTQKYFQQHYVNDYNKSHKDGQIQMSIKQIDTLDRLLRTAVASGRGPDIIVADGPAQSLAYVDSGNLLPLDSYVKKFDWASKLLPWALETGRVKGKFYSVPNSYETMALFYNPGTFSKYGWNVPTNKNDFEEICKEAAGKGLTPVNAGSADWKPTTEWFVTVFFNSAAGPEAVYQALQGKTKWSDPVFVDAITQLNGYFQKGWFGGGTQAYFTNKDADMDTKLAQGKSAMAITGSWAISEYDPYFGKAAGNDARWDWAPIPKLSDHAPADVYDLSVGGTYAVNKDSKHPEQAAAYLDWLISSPKRQADALAAVAQEPAPIKFQDSDFPSSIDDRVKRMYVSLANAKNVGYTTWTFWPPKSDTYIYQSMDKVITGKMTPAEYCAGLDKVFDPELKAGKVPPLPAPVAGG